MLLSNEKLHYLTQKGQQADCPFTKLFNKENLDTYKLWTTLCASKLWLVTFGQNFFICPIQENTSPPFKNLKFLKLIDTVKQNNMIYIHDTINVKTPAIFQSY